MAGKSTGSVSAAVINFQWVNSFLPSFKAAVHDMEPLWNFGSLELQKAFDVRRQNLSRLRPTLYSLRNGGASEDWFESRRERSRASPGRHAPS